jgi:hypothetical protein
MAAMAERTLAELNRIDVLVNKLALLNEVPARHGSARVIFGRQGPTPATWRSAPR